jgi:hypothetical protein
LTYQKNCHPDRSVAQWRDLRFYREYQFPRKRCGPFINTANAAA